MSFLCCEAPTGRLEMFGHDPISYISPERAQAALSNMPVPVGMFMNMSHVPPRFYNQHQQAMQGLYSTSRVESLANSGKSVEESILPRLVLVPTFPFTDLWVEPLINGLGFFRPHFLCRLLLRSHKQFVSHSLKTSKHSSQTRHRCRQVTILVRLCWCLSVYQVQVNNSFWFSWASSFMTGGLNWCFHKLLLYPVNSFSGLGSVPGKPVVRGIPTNYVPVLNLKVESCTQRARNSIYALIKLLWWLSE